MDKDHPHLTLVDPNNSPDLQEEFAPLPYYPWDERPPTLALDRDECATAIHLAHGDLESAAALLKAPYHRLARLVRVSPHLQRIQAESLDRVLAAAMSIPIRTLFDPQADARRLEWASTKVLQSKLAQRSPLSPAPAQSAQSASLSLNQNTRTLTFRWRTDDDDRNDDV